MRRSRRNVLGYRIGFLAQKHRVVFRTVEAWWSAEGTRAGGVFREGESSRAKGFGILCFSFCEFLLSCFVFVAVRPMVSLHGFGALDGAWGLWGLGVWGFEAGVCTLRLSLLLRDFGLETLSDCVVEIGERGCGALEAWDFVNAPLLTEGNGG